MQDCYLTGRNYDQVKFWQEVCRNTTVLGTASGGYFLEKKLHTVPVPGTIPYRYLFIVNTEHRLILIIATSVEEPNTLNFHPDPEFWLNLDLVPGLCFQC